MTDAAEIEEAFKDLKAVKETLNAKYNAVSEKVREYEKGLKLHCLFETNAWPSPDGKLQFVRFNGAPRLICERLDGVWVPLIEAPITLRCALATWLPTFVKWVATQAPSD